MTYFSLNLGTFNDIFFKNRITSEAVLVEKLECFDPVSVLEVITYTYILNLEGLRYHLIILSIYVQSIIIIVDYVLGDSDLFKS